MSIEVKLTRAYNSLLSNVSEFIDKFKKKKRFKQYNLERFGLTTESIKEIKNLPKLFAYAAEIVATLKADHPALAYFDYSKQYNAIIRELKILEPVVNKMMKDNKFKQNIIQNLFKFIDEEFWKNNITEKGAKTCLLMQESPLPSEGMDILLKKSLYRLI
jgi:hypothetical protein